MKMWDEIPKIWAFTSSRNKNASHVSFLNASAASAPDVQSQTFEAKNTQHRSP